MWMANNPVIKLSTHYQPKKNDSFNIRNFLNNYKKIYKTPFQFNKFLI